jgi:hypothetical protein
MRPGHAAHLLGPVCHEFVDDVFGGHADAGVFLVGQMVIWYRSPGWVF